MPGKKKALDLSPLSYFMDIPQKEDAPPSEPPAPPEEAQPIEISPPESAEPPKAAEAGQSRRPGRPAVEKENRNKIFSICMTPSLYEDLRLLSELHGVSVNSYIVGLLGDQVEKNRDAVDQIKAIKKNFHKKV